MCCRRSEGVIYKRCAHYVPQAYYDKRDCNNRFCTLSARHPRNCANCTCETHWYPDWKQDTIGYVEGACSNCYAWFAARPVVQPRR